MRKYFKIYTIMVAAVLAASSCSKDLNLKPTNEITSDIAYANPEGYRNVMAKVYGSFAQTGNNGAGSGDLGGIDPGTSDFFRLYFGAQELSTDEAICAWVNDPGVSEVDQMTWSSGNLMLRGLYTRSLYQITLVNEFIRESTDAKLSQRGISGADATEIKYYVAEARFLRAFQYWVLLDLYGNPPFITEADEIGVTPPKQIKRADLYNYVESELLAVEGLLKDPKTNEYGRADKAAAWALLARFYLNAQVYTGTAKNTEAATYAKRVIDAGYTLHSQYKNLFLADNNISNPETIFAIAYDGVKTQTYGGATYLINAAVSGAMNPTSFGVPTGGWGGNRTRQNLPNLFTDISGNTDKRAMFFGDKKEVDDITLFTDGLAVTKFKNITQAGVTAPSIGGMFCSMDIPLFRLGEMYLIYAEASLRGGDQGTARTYLNLLRTRAYEGNGGNFTGTITLDNILDERGRELYWEGHRRTDLIRFGRYTEGTYLWPFKGGIKAGRGVESFRNIFPLPSADVIANPNLVQNTGY